MSSGLTSRRALLFPALLIAVAMSVPACGGGGAGAGPGGAGQGLVLTNFYQGGQDNVPINRVLRFEFSEPVASASIGASDGSSSPSLARGNAASTLCAPAMLRSTATAASVSTKLKRIVYFPVGPARQTRVTG